MTPLRWMVEADLPAVAELWHGAWHDAHGTLVDPSLAALRTPRSFAERLPAMLTRTKVAGPTEAPLGFCTVTEDELDHLFVCRDARGTGLAAALLADGEHRLAGLGVRRAWLACAVGNKRAQRFYHKAGWEYFGRVEILSTPVGGRSFPVLYDRFEKTLLDGAAGSG